MIRSKPPSVLQRILNLSIKCLILSLLLFCMYRCSRDAKKERLLEKIHANSKPTKEAVEKEVENSKTKKIVSEEEKRLRVKLLRELFKKTGFVSLPYEVDNNYIERNPPIYSLDPYRQDEVALMSSGFRFVIAVLPDTTSSYMILHSIPAGIDILQMIVYSKDGEVLDNKNLLEDHCVVYVGEVSECVDKIIINRDLSMTYHHHSKVAYEDYTRQNEYDTICAEKNSRGIINVNGRIIFEKVKMDTLECK